MKARGINSQLLVAGVAPAVAVTLVVTAWLVTAHVSDLREQQQRLGQVVASQLAPAAEYGVFSGNTPVLQRLAAAALTEADLRSVTIRDRDGMALASARQPPLPGSDSSAAAVWLAQLLVGRDATVRFEAPVVQPVIDLGEFDLPAAAFGGGVIGSVEIEIALLPAVARQLDAILTGVLLALSGLLVSLLLARRLGERVGGPIQRLADAMRRVRDGDLSVRVPEESTTELGLLESGLNRMADEVERTQRTLEEQVERATSDLNQTVNALEVSNVELDLARRRALESSHLKSEFLAVMSHEIRTPMSGIIGFANLLARSRLDAEQQEQVLTIQKSADTLMLILNDILDLSRIEAGKLALADEPFDVRECVDDVLSLLAPLAYGKGLDLRRCVRRAVPARVRGDAMRLQQVLTNLVGNAIKYTVEGGITVEVGLAGGAAAGAVRLEISVSDTGIGIADEVQRQLFRAFSQVHVSTAQYPGAGLGLVICSKLVEAMGGEVELRSEPGAGSRFAVTFSLGLEPAQPRPPRWPGRRVLWCEADPLTRDHIAQLLEANGLEVTAVATPPTTPADGFDALLFGAARADDALLAAFAAAARAHPAVVLLLGSVDPNECERARRVLHGICLPRCLMAGSLLRTLGILFGERVPDAAGPALRQALAGLHLLVVDDNRINRLLLARQLVALGATTDEAASGEEALTMCAAGTYDAVLLDLQMPGIGGRETARRLRTTAPGTLVIAITANALIDEELALHDTGIAGVMIKPVDEARLAELLLDHHARRAALRAQLRRLDAKVARMLTEDFPALAAAYRAALRQQDGAALRAALHDIAGTAAACRLHGLADAAAAARATDDDAALVLLSSEIDALENLL